MLVNTHRISKHAINCAMKEISERLKAARIEAGFESVADAARALHVKYSTYAAHENGGKGFGPGKLELYARRFKVSTDWLLTGKGQGPRVANSINSPDRFDTNAQIISNSNFTERSIPLYGKAVGGPHGEILFDGEVMAHVNSPPILAKVKNPYAVYVAGDSMEPRYFEGEIVYVDPDRVPVRGNFVVAQIQIEKEGPPHAFIKRLVRWTTTELVLEQLNPKEQLRFTEHQLNNLKLHVAVASTVE